MGRGAASVALQIDGVMALFSFLFHYQSKAPFIFYTQFIRVPVLHKIPFNSNCIIPHLEAFIYIMMCLNCHFNP